MDKMSDCLYEVFVRFSKLAQTTGPIFIKFAQNLYFRPEYMHKSEMEMLNHAISLQDYTNYTY